MDRAVREDADGRRHDATPVRAGDTIAATPRIGTRSLSSTILQAKLTVGPAADPAEREADAVADRITRALHSPGVADVGSDHADPRIRRAHVASTVGEGHGSRARPVPADRIQQRDSLADAQRKIDKSTDPSKGPTAEIATAALSGDVQARSDATLKLVKANTARADHPYVAARSKANGDKEPNSVKKNFKWEWPHRNRDGHLPGVAGAGGYTEYYINRLDASGVPSEGPTSYERLVVGGSNVFHTATHYGDQGSPPFTHIV